jgi:hypothetical protein
VTSVNRVGDRTSGRTEETIRIGLTEAQAETLALVMRRIGGPSGIGHGSSRRVHCDELLRALAEAGVMTYSLDATPASGDVRFEMDALYDRPLDPASKEVTYL